MLPLATPQGQGKAVGDRSTELLCIAREITCTVLSLIVKGNLANSYHDKCQGKKTSCELMKQGKNSLEV